MLFLKKEQLQMKDELSERIKINLKKNRNEKKGEGMRYRRHLKNIEPLCNKNT